MGTVKIGAQVVLDSEESFQYFQGNVGLLCHSASILPSYDLIIGPLKEKLGGRLKALYSPQHGLVTDVQDNMIESNHSQHPFYDMPVYSLYSETRKPTPDMLRGIDTFVVDLQDIGARVYTYIYTMALSMQACAEAGIPVVVLDRPNPIGDVCEGTILEKGHESFVGKFPIPMRHGLTLGEVAVLFQKTWIPQCELKVIKMDGYDRSMHFEQTGLPWVPPSPNIPSTLSCWTFPGTVYLEGTMLSEGRGTTRPLEFIGHPELHAERFTQHCLDQVKSLDGCLLRPASILPMFQKHAGTPCHGVFIHVEDRKKFRSWRVGLELIREAFHVLGDAFEWRPGPYEYEYDRNPFDVISGNLSTRTWIEKRGDISELAQQEERDLEIWKRQIDGVKLYR